MKIDVVTLVIKISFALVADGFVKSVMNVKMNVVIMEGLRLQRGLNYPQERRDNNGLRFTYKVC